MTSSGSSLSTECAQEPPDQAGTTPENLKDDSDLPSGALGSDKTAKAWSPKRGPKFNGSYHGVMGGYIVLLNGSLRKLSTSPTWEVCAELNKDKDPSPVVFQECENISDPCTDPQE